MKEDEILRAIELAIRRHEIRVAIFSGIGGIILIAGTWHAIFMLNNAG